MRASVALAAYSSSGSFSSSSAPGAERNSTTAPTRKITSATALISVVGEERRQVPGEHGDQRLHEEGQPDARSTPANGL